MASANLFHVSAIFSEKHLWAVLQFLKAQKAYNVEVIPVDPPSGLLAAPEVEASRAHARENASEPDALAALIKGRRGKASAIRQEIVKSLIESGEVRTDEYSKRKEFGAHDLRNAVYFLVQRKLMKRIGYQHYKATPKLLAVGNGAAS